MFEGIRKLSVGIVLILLGGALILFASQAVLGEKFVGYGIIIAVGGNIVDHTFAAIKNGKKKE